MNPYETEPSQFLAWQQQQNALSNNIYGQYWALGIMGATNTTTTPLNFTITSTAISELPRSPAPKPAPDTALAWLDRRVEEIRVRL